MKHSSSGTDVKNYASFTTECVLLRALSFPHIYMQLDSSLCMKAISCLLLTVKTLLKHSRWIFVS
jgi:hypothetical protein